MRALRIILRVGLGILGGYGLSAATSAALALALYQLGSMDRAEATVLCAMLGFAFYLFVLLWALTAPALGRVAVVLCGGCLIGWLVVHWLAPSSAIAVSPLLIPIGVGG